MKISLLLSTFLTAFLAVPVMAFHCTLTQINSGVKVSDPSIRTVIAQGALPDPERSYYWHGTFVAATGERYFYNVDVSAYDETNIDVGMHLGLSNAEGNAMQGKAPSAYSRNLVPPFKVELISDNQPVHDTSLAPSSSGLARSFLPPIKKVKEKDMKIVLSLNTLFLVFMTASAFADTPKSVNCKLTRRTENDDKVVFIAQGSFNPAGPAEADRRLNMRGTFTDEKSVVYKYQVGMFYDPPYGPYYLDFSMLNTDAKGESAAPLSSAHLQFPAVPFSVGLAHDLKEDLNEAHYWHGGTTVYFTCQ